MTTNEPPHWQGDCPECGNELDTHGTIAECTWCDWKDEF